SQQLVLLLLISLGLLLTSPRFTARPLASYRLKAYGRLHICLCVYIYIDIQRTLSKTCNELRRNCHGTGPGSWKTVIIRDCSGTHKSWLLFLLFLFLH
ncbi:unnamed protein product, partial [Bubo scandiacus]